MAEGMFCPRCRSLLTPERRGRTTERVCRRCGYREGATAGGGAAAPEKPPGRTAPHPEFPLFPYGRIRDGQREFMEDLRTAVRTGKILIGQAPTGIGKTAATLSVLLEEAGRSGRLVFFLTSKQSQHRIVIDTLREMSSLAPRGLRAVDVTSKQSMCPRVRAGMPGYAFMEFCKAMVRSRKCRLQGRDYERARDMVLSGIMHVNELVGLSGGMGLCPHKVAMDAMANADLVVCDYNYMFDVMAPQVLERTGRPLGEIDLIIDEAHNLPDRIRDNMSMELTSFKMGEAVREARKGGQAGAAYTAGLESAIEAWAGELAPGGETRVEKARLIGELNRIFTRHLGDVTIDGYVKWLSEVGERILKAGANLSYAMELAGFLEGWASDGSSMVRILRRQESGSWTLKLCFLDPGEVAGPVLGRVHSAVLMSGTLYPPDMYADVLGVPEGRRMGRAYVSPFPRENRKVLAVRGVTTRYVKRGRDMDETTARYILGLAGSAGGNVAAFFPSYRLMRGVAAVLGDSLGAGALLVEEQGMTKTAREAYIRRLRRFRDGGRLLLAVQGGSLSEGMDYQGNLLAAVAVVGIPLAPPNLEVKSLTDHYTGRFGRERGYLYGYLAPAINKVVQGAGRLIRSEMDRGVIVLMDERFLQPGFAALLPPDLKPEPVGSVGELADAVSAFFGSDRPTDAPRGSRKSAKRKYPRGH